MSAVSVPVLEAALQLAKARQDLAHEGTGYVPSWDELDAAEAQCAIQAARWWLLAAERAGLITLAVSS